jgi:beta-lactam-binding protein with PASTA domain
MKKNYTINISVERLWKFYLPLGILLLTTGFLVGVWSVDAFIMPRVVGVSNKGEIVVPSLVNTLFDEAREKLYSIGLRVQVSAWEYDSKFPKGFVISQQPGPGEKVKRNRVLNVVLSKGQESDTIPEIKELTEPLARSALRRSGFGRISVKRVYDEKVLQDQVIRTEPKSGTIISREVPVEIIISKGTRPTHVLAPSIIGDMLSEAQDKIEESGLVVGSISYQHGSGSPAGTVISQSASPGMNLPLESAVDLTVAAGQ